MAQPSTVTELRAHVGGGGGGGGGMVTSIRGLPLGREALPTLFYSRTADIAELERCFIAPSDRRPELAEPPAVPA